MSVSKTKAQLQHLQPTANTQCWHLRNLSFLLGFESAADNGSSELLRTSGMPIKHVKGVERLLSWPSLRTIKFSSILCIIYFLVKLCTLLCAVTSLCANVALYTNNNPCISCSFLPSVPTPF
jgi:hypothetical protein